jgi:hypothetical protein
MGRNDHDDLTFSPGRYAGLLDFGQRRKLLRGDDESYKYKGYDAANNRLLCGRTFATRLKRAGEYEQDIFNLFLPDPEEIDD